MASLPLNDTLPLRSPICKISTSSSPVIGSSNTPLDASRDARQVVRLAQCPQCSYPLRELVTLPCGNTLCKKCIPEPHERENISYPATPNRKRGFRCPFASCRKEHAVEDCSVDVVLNKIMEFVREETEKFRNTVEASGTLLQVEEKDRWAVAGVTSLRDKEPSTQVLRGGRLAATYAMAEMGELAYDSEVIYTEISSGGSSTEVLDTTLLDYLKEATRGEVDCQVCYGLLLDPLTTACGHTYCRRCVHRVLDHTNICPVCRRVLSIRPGPGSQQEPSNILLTKILMSLCTEAQAEREAAAQIEATSVGDLDTPLFICTLSWPTMPTFLYIFEPRYRLMIRRAVENGNRKFGMLFSNLKREPQGDLGVVPFLQYGTLLHIVNMHLLPDGRSMIETVGVSRFRVLQHGVLDGYTIGKIERLDDISIEAEEALEASETTPTSASLAVKHSGAPQPPGLPNLDSMSTQGLMEIGLTFVKTMRGASAAWLTSRVIIAYGECPEDPALFPWWFASVLPLGDEDKVELLQTTSVRERLKICVKWIAQFEASKCNAERSSCTAL